MLIQRWLIAWCSHGYIIFLFSGRLLSSLCLELDLCRGTWQKSFISNKRSDMRGTSLSIFYVINATQNRLPPHVVVKDDIHAWIMVSIFYMLYFHPLDCGSFTNEGYWQQTGAMGLHRQTWIFHISYELILVKCKNRIQNGVLFQKRWKKCDR